MNLEGDRDRGGASPGTDGVSAHPRMLPPLWQCIQMAEWWSTGCKLCARKQVSGSSEIHCVLGWCPGTCAETTPDHTLDVSLYLGVLPSHYMCECLPAPSGCKTPYNLGLLSSPAPCRHGYTHTPHRSAHPDRFFFFRFHCCHVPLGLHLFVLPVDFFTDLILANTNIFFRIHHGGHLLPPSPGLD